MQSSLKGLPRNPVYQHRRDWKEPPVLLPKSCLDIPPVTPVGYDSLSVRDRQTVDSVITAFLDQQKYRQAN
ncbi:MAG: hypothetical protein IJT94_15110 [Oscillibacter sp.]|nr:hypothetical protein [Oscillibacter sp.]